MKSTTKIKAITAALIVSALFLIIGVDYLPHLVAWLPMLVTATFALSSRAWVAHINKWLDKVMPID
jgi:hypothetical protein